MTPTRGERAGWIFSRRADCLFFSNIYWPVLALAAYCFARQDSFAFLFILLSMTHRWLTFPLVAIDWSNVRQRKRELALGSCLVLLTYLFMLHFVGGFPTLALAVVLFDSWHRSSQHYGILRIYGRHSPSSDGANTMELTAAKLLRVFSLYVFLRALSFLESFNIGATIREYTPTWVASIDIVAFGIPIILLLISMTGGRIIAKNTLRPRQPQSHYLASMTLLYASLLGAIYLDASQWVRCLFLAGVTVHAVEYLAITSRRIRHKNEVGATSAMRFISEQWYWLLALFVAGLVITGWYMPLRFADIWVGLNLLASLLHYQIDGVIWKRSPHHISPSHQEEYAG